MLLFYYITPRAYHRRLRRVGLICIVLLAALWGRIAWLQVVQNDLWEDRARGRLERTTPLPFARGTIRDRSGRPIVEDLRSYDLMVVPADFYRETRTGQLWRVLQLLGRAELRQGLRHFLAHREEAVRTFFSIPARDIVNAGERLGLDAPDRSKVYYYVNRLIDSKLVPGRQRALRFLRNEAGQSTASLHALFPEAAAEAWRGIQQEAAALEGLGSRIPAGDGSWDPIEELDQLFSGLPGRIDGRIRDWKARRRLEQDERRAKEAAWLTGLRELLFGAAAWEPEEEQRLRRQIEEDLLERAYRIERSVPYEAVTHVSLHHRLLGGWSVRPTTVRRPAPGAESVAPHLIGFLREIRSESYESWQERLALWRADLERARSQPDDPVRRFWAQNLEQLIARSRYSPTSLHGWRGIEERLEGRLRGIDGELVEARGGESTEILPPQDGEDVWLTIDLELQEACEAALDQAPTAEAGGAVVVLDVASGAALALATRPRRPGRSLMRLYAELDGQEPYELVDKARDYWHPPAPGSVMKPFIALGALEEGFMKPGERVRCEKYLVHDGRQYQCEGLHGDVDVVEALGKSCNIYFYELGRRMAERLGGAEAAGERLHRWCARFGFGGPTGLSVSEKVGRLDTPTSVAEIIQYVIGQGTTSVTPLQVARGMAGLAGGRLPSARVVAQVGEQAVPPSSAALGIQGWARAIVGSGMAHTVDGGTAREALRGRSDVAGKTGSAQVAGERSHAWFAGWVPRERPQVVVVVYLKRGGGGGADAAPVARAILESEAWQRCVGF